MGHICRETLELSLLGVARPKRASLWTSTGYGEELIPICSSTDLNAIANANVGQNAYRVVDSTAPDSKPGKSALQR